MVCLEHCTEDKTCQLEQLKIYEDSNDEMNEDNETDYAEMVAEVLTGRLSPFQQLAVGKVTAAAQQGLPADNSNDTDEEAEGNSNDDIENQAEQRINDQAGAVKPKRLHDADWSIFGKWVAASTKELHDPARPIFR